MKYFLQNHPMLTGATRTRQQGQGIGCDCIDGVDQVITGQVTQSADAMISGNLIVQTGAQLTVTGKLSFQNGARLYVAKGARLIVDGGTLTSACPYAYWGGVNVAGDRGRIQPSDPYGALSPQDAGVVIVKNEGVIEQAKTGIYTGDVRVPHPGHLSTFGGLIYTEDAVFRDNQTAVKFQRYDIANKSEFINTTFEMTALMPHGHDANGILNWANDDVTITNCSFEHLNVGVLIQDADCDLYDQQQFIDCRRGVYVLSTGPIMASLRIQPTPEGQDAATFINNGTGVQATAANVDIISANFLESTPTNYPSNIGIELQGEGTFYVYENAFTDLDYGVSFIDNGRGSGAASVTCNNMGSNDLFDEEIGIYGYGWNPRVTFLYNTFLFNDPCDKPDVLLQHRAGVDADVVTPVIGDPSGRPADNCFSGAGPTGTLPLHKPQIVTLDESLTSPQFRYWIPTPQYRIDCERPWGAQNNTNPQYWFTFAETQRLFPNCRYQGPSSGLSITEMESAYAVNILAAQSPMLSQAELDGLALERNLLRQQLIFAYRDAGRHADILTMLQADPTIAGRRALYGHLLDQGAYTSAETVLLSMPRISGDEQAFYDVQRINLDRLRDPLYSPDSADLHQLLTVSTSTLPERFYARAVLSVLSAMDDDTQGGDDRPPPFPCQWQGTGTSRLAASSPSDEVTLYPNPTTGIVQVDIAGGQEIRSYEVLDTDGRVVQRAIGHHTMIDLSPSTSGIYILKVMLTDGTTSVHKLAKE